MAKENVVNFYEALKSGKELQSKLKSAAEIWGFYKKGFKGLFG